MSQSKDHHDPASFSRARSAPYGSVRQSRFAGRIGGNQEFVTTGNDQDDHDLLDKQPDAAPITRFAAAFDPKGFLVLDTWRQAIVEGWGTCLLVFVFGASATGLPADGESAFANTIFAALINTVGLSLFIFSAAPASGGHLNPSITMATTFAGLCSVPRAVLYLSAQSVGAIVGGYWLRLGLGDDFYFPSGVIPGCTVDPKFVSVGQLFALEFMFAQALIFIASGVGLDPRQAKVFGPAFAPILVGASLGFGTLASGLAKRGYYGVSFNPARCLGLMTAKGELQYHWVHWVAPFCAGMLNGFFYYFFPPYIREKSMAAWNPMHHVGED